MLNASSKSKYLLLGLVSAISIFAIGFLLVDRARLKSSFEKQKQEATVDALRRQLAIRTYDRSETVTAFAKKLHEKNIDAIDLTLFVESSDILNVLWKNEKEIDSAQFERATVTAKRIMESLACDDTESYTSLAKKLFKQVNQDSTESIEIDEPTLIEILGLESEEQFRPFLDFLSRACQDEVSSSEDPIQLRMENAPNHVFRLF